MSKDKTVEDAYAELSARLDPEAVLHEKQLAFFRDPSQFKTALCGRQSGKTEAGAIVLTKTALDNPGAALLYVTKSKRVGQDIMWGKLNSINETYNLGMEFKYMRGDVTFPNGSIIHIRGADCRSEMDKLRGLTLTGIYVDETQNFTIGLDYMLNDVLFAATLRHKAWVICAGTPNASCTGPFFEMTTAEDGLWSNHKWTTVDNPYLPDVAETLQNYRDKMGWTEDNPTFQREFMANWARDSSLLVFRYSDHANILQRFEPKPDEDWRYVLGIDFGFEDATAFVVLAYSKLLGKVVVVESAKEEKLNPAQASAVVDRYCQLYKFERMIGDSGALGKGYVETFNAQYPVHGKIWPAYKVDKLSQINLINADFESHALQIVAESNQELIEELRMAQWSEMSLRYGKFTIERKVQDHLIDAMQYGISACHHRGRGQWAPEGPRRHTAEWYEAQEAKLEASATDRAKRAGDPLWKRLARNRAK